MELAAVLRHQGPPRGAYFIENPTPLGKLRLDIIGDAWTVLRGDLAPEERQDARQKSAQAHDLLRLGDVKGAESAYLALVQEYPTFVGAYYGLTALYYREENWQEYEYYLKQIIALAPDYEDMADLGTLLGQLGRYEEAETLQDYLWQNRASQSRGMVWGVALDYLVTLSRLNKPEKMIEVADQAISEAKTVMPELSHEYLSKLYYQRALALLLLNRKAEARASLDEAIGWATADPFDSHLDSKFIQMRQALDEA